MSFQHFPLRVWLLVFKIVFISKPQIPSVGAYVACVTHCSWCAPAQSTHSHLSNRIQGKQAHLVQRLVESLPLIFWLGADLMESGLYHILCDPG